MAGIRQTFKKGPGSDSTAPSQGSERPGKKKRPLVKVPKDKGRPKRKVKVTFNSPKTTKISY